MKWLLGGFILWLAMKGRFANYAALTAPAAGGAATPAQTGASSSAPTPAGTGTLAGEIYLGGGAHRAPGSALALPGMAQ